MPGRREVEEMVVRLFGHDPTRQRAILIRTPGAGGA